MILKPTLTTRQPPDPDMFIIDPITAADVLRSTQDMLGECQDHVLAATEILESKCNRPIRQRKLVMQFDTDNPETIGQCAIEWGQINDTNTIYFELPGGPYDIEKISFLDIDDNLLNSITPSIRVIGDTYNPVETIQILKASNITSFLTGVISIEAMVGWPSKDVPKALYNACRLLASSIFDKATARTENQITDLIEPYQLLGFS